MNTLDTVIRCGELISGLIRIFKNKVNATGKCGVYVHNIKKREGLPEGRPFRRGENSLLVYTSWGGVCAILFKLMWLDFKGIFSVGNKNLLKT